MNAITPIDKEESAEQRWSRFKPIVTGEDYVNSLRNRNLTVYLMGEKIGEPVDHPIIRPSINALRKTYELAIEEPELATAWSPLIEAPVNRFLHIVESPDDLVLKNRMQRRMGQLTGTCFQRCAGLDTISVLHSITYDIDQKHGTDYHQRGRALCDRCQGPHDRRSEFPLDLRHAHHEHAGRGQGLCGGRAGPG